MSHPVVICERLVQGDRDMLDIEKCIVSELGPLHGELDAMEAGALSCQKRMRTEGST
jgi:hypothetical protein